MKVKSSDVFEIVVALLVVALLARMCYIKGQNDMLNDIEKAVDEYEQVYNVI